MVWPQPSVTVPQSIVFGSGVQVSAAQLPASDTTGPPASGAWQLPFTQARPPVHPPQLTATPQPSSATTPQRPVHAFGLHDCDIASWGSATQTLPPVHGVPHAKV
jgi:hypothetical protein